MTRRVRMGCALVITSLLALPLRAGEAVSVQAVTDWLRAYDAALNAKDLQRLAGFYHPDVTIFEGGSTNHGWADYRDNHLGPELEEMQNLQFSHFNVKVQSLGPDSLAAYVTAEYRLKARVEDREVDDATGLETLVLVRDEQGAWRIRHSHTSSRRKAAASPRQE